MSEAELNVVTAPKDSVFQARINKEIKAMAEEYCNISGLTLTDAFNMMIQTIIMEKRIPWIANPGRTLSQDDILMMLVDKLERSRKSMESKSYSQDELEKHFGV